MSWIEKRKEQIHEALIRAEKEGHVQEQEELLAELRDLQEMK